MQARFGAVISGSLRHAVAVDTVARLDALLMPYWDGDPVGESVRLVDLPPDVAEAALRLVDDDPAADLRTPFPYDQPSPRRLIAIARALDGRLVGACVIGRGYLHLDGVQVPAHAAASLLDALNDVPGARAAAVAEAWTSWDADRPAWTGPARNLLDHLPSGGVAGCWWD